MLAFLVGVVEKLWKVGDEMRGEDARVKGDSGGLEGGGMVGGWVGDGGEGVQAGGLRGWG